MPDADDTWSRWLLGQLQGEVQAQRFIDVGHHDGRYCADPGPDPLDRNGTDLLSLRLRVPR